MRKRSQKHIRERIANAVDISRDIILDVALIRLTGTNELIIENYKGIIEYTSTCIFLKANPKNIKIIGNSLEIGTITDEMLYISGEIDELNFCS